MLPAGRRSCGWVELLSAADEQRLVAQLQQARAEEYRALMVQAERPRTRRWTGCVVSCAGSGAGTTSRRPSRSSPAARSTPSPSSPASRPRPAPGVLVREVGDPGRGAHRPGASAWLIRRFIDPDATFVFVTDPAEVPTDAIAFDMRGVDFGHHGDDCTFETLLRRHDLLDPVLWRIAAIVHEADLEDDRYDAPEAPGLDVVLRGLSMVRDDDQVLAHGTASSTASTSTTTAPAGRKGPGMTHHDPDTGRGPPSNSPLRRTSRPRTQPRSPVT